MYYCRDIMLAPSESDASSIWLVARKNTAQYGELDSWILLVWDKGLVLIGLQKHSIKRKLFDSLAFFGLFVGAASTLESHSLWPATHLLSVSLIPCTRQSCVLFLLVLSFTI